MNIPASKYTRVAEWLIKLTLMALAAYYLIYRLKKGGYEGVFTYSWHHPLLLIPGFLWLWLQNLWLDAVIWRRVHFMILPLSWLRAFKTNLICYALAFITPANSGELAGRYIMLPQGEARRKTLFLTFWSHMPRLMVKLILGLIALAILVNMNNSRFFFPFWLASLLAAALIIAYFNITFIQRRLSLWGWREFRLSNYVLGKRPEFSEKLSLLLLALLKFLTYNAQFLILLVMWSNITWSLELVASIIGFYVVSALIPTFAAADFLIKAGLAVLIFNPLLASQSLLINAAFITWAFNIATPALAGSLLILNTNLKHSLKKKFSRGNRYDSLH